MGKPLVIKNWQDLADLKETDTYTIEVDVNMELGWINVKNKDNTHLFSRFIYLSTHSFDNPNWLSDIPNESGFNVVVIPE